MKNPSRIIEKTRVNVVKVDGKVLRVRDTYNVESASDQENFVILAVTVALDNIGSLTYDCL